MPAPRPPHGRRPRARTRTGPPAPAPAQDTVGDLVRWAAFSCVLVPVVLVWYGTSLAGATGAALGLAAVTAVCRALLRRSERHAARAALEAHRPRPAHASDEPRGRQESRTGPGGRQAAHARTRQPAHAGVSQGAHRGGRRPRRNTPVD
ncbi:hypothetical protein [Streptomyces sp. B3I8]|uniref:hypothetical protein n=1 Tax=Streptomyces sp. B3I8 TaxID=3042303 RepID=UPI002786F308|nr:hypothetical protein [Streptomyces sp. B3I8]MDQ0787131.1 hypothetical protein [Streptomyces sp. B3I8]